MNEKKHKLPYDIVTLIVVLALVIAISLIVNGVKRGSPNEQFKYSEWGWSDYVTIDGIKNEDYVIKKGVLEIPATIEGKPVCLGSSAIESSNITTLVLPRSLYRVYSDSLKGCTNLKNIIFEGTLEEWKKIDNIEDWDISKYTFTHEGDCDCSEWITSSGYNCETGGTKTRTCLYCSEVYTESIAPTHHTTVTIPGVSPTCTEDGKSAGKECSKCGCVVETPVVISALGHETVIDKAVPATCTQNGLTEGSHCSRCNTVIKKQTSTSLAEHSLGAWETDWEATCVFYGAEIRFCANCSYEESREVAPWGHKFVNGYCELCSVPVASVGLELKLIEDSYYEVAGIGTCTDKHIVIPDTYNGKQVSSIGNSAFWGEAIESVYIPETIWVIGDYAFRSCTGLTTIEIPENVMQMGVGMLKDCTNLKELTIPYAPEYLGYLFVETSTDYGYTDNDTVVPKALTKVILTGWDTIPNHAFAYCEFIQEIVLSEHIVAIENSAFDGCESLIKINLPSSLTMIGDYAFRDCSNLPSISIPANVISIGVKVFEDCWRLEDIQWSSNAKITSLGQGAFWGCSDLTKLIIPKTVTYLGANLITGCYNISELIFEEPSGWYCYQYDYTTYDVPTKGLQTSSSALNYLYETYEWYQWERTISSTEKNRFQQYINSSNFTEFVDETQGLSYEFMSTLTFNASQQKAFFDFLIKRMEYVYVVEDFVTEFSKDEQYYKLIADYADAGNMVAFAEILGKVADYSYSDNPYMTLFTYNYKDISALWSTQYLKDFLTSEYCITYYLAGYWRDPSYSNRYIRFYAESSSDSTWCTYNNVEFPNIEYDHWDLSENIMTFCDENGNVLANAFKIKFISANQIELYCYEGGKTYTLTRT